MESSDLHIKIPIVSPINVLYDLTDCVTTVNTKVSKRLKRLRAVCLCLNMDPETYISQLVIAKEKGIDIPIANVLEYLNRAPSKNETGIIELPTSEEYDESVKKYIEAMLTAKLNSDLSLYYETCEVAHKIVNRIRHHLLFGPLFDDKRIIFVHKGGIAQRISLLDKFPKYKSEIESAFNLGGDNDCNIIIDPQLPDYDSVRSQLVKYVHTQMLDLVESFSEGKVREKAETVTSIEISIPSVGGTTEYILNIPVESTKRNNFRLYSEGIGTHYLDIDVDKNSVHVSSNDTLKFTDEIGRTCHFTLLRYKKGFKVGNRILGAELLDISIPYRDETKAYESFHHYYSGQWINFVHI